MRRTMLLLRVAAGAVAALALLAFVPGAEAPHVYRGTGQGCSEADGALPEALPGAPPSTGPVAATVLLLHNAFLDTGTGLPVTVINAGQSVRFEWASSHCHSVRSTTFYSGYHFPSSVPELPSEVPVVGGMETPAAAPGLFHYPVFDLSPTMSYTHTFAEAGVFAYDCEHHMALGMVGVVVVQ